MADAIHDGYRVGSTGNRIFVDLRKTADNLEKTGVAHTDVTAKYVRMGSLPVSITMASLVAADSAYASGGWKEYDASGQPGLYRFDLPDAIFTSGADIAEVTVKVAGCYVKNYKFPLTSTKVQTGDSFARLGTPVGADISADIAALVNSIFNFTLAELTQGSRSATPSFKEAVMLWYMWMRNKRVATATEEQLFNDAGTMINKRTLSNVSGTFTKDELVAGT